MSTVWNLKLFFNFLNRVKCCKNWYNPRKKKLIHYRCTLNYKRPFQETWHLVRPFSGNLTWILPEMKTWRMKLWYSQESWYLKDGVVSIPTYVMLSACIGHRHNTRSLCMCVIILVAGTRLGCYKIVKVAQFHDWAKKKSGTGFIVQPISCRFLADFWKNWIPCTADFCKGRPRFQEPRVSIIFGASNNFWLWPKTKIQPSNWASLSVVVRQSPTVLRDHTDKAFRCDGVLLYAAHLGLQPGQSSAPCGQIEEGDLLNYY